MESKKFTLGVQLALVVLATGCGRPLTVQEDAFYGAAEATVAASPRPRSVPISNTRPVPNRPPEESERPGTEAAPSPAPAPMPTPKPVIPAESKPAPAPAPSEKTPAPAEPPPAVAAPAPVPLPTPAPTPSEPPTRPAPVSLAGIDWGNGNERPTLDGKPVPLGMLPYWYDYPWKRVPEQTKWNEWLLTELGSHKAFVEGTPSNITNFCPRYGSLGADERKLFWLRFFSVLSEMESTFDSKNVTHDTGVGPNIYSSGLLQLSLASVQYKPYGCTMIREQRDLLDAKKNLACGVRMMAHFLRKDGTATGFLSSWRGGARYWAPLRHDYLRSSSGRRTLTEWIAKYRSDWKQQGMSSRHPATDDSARRAKGEKKLEKLLRLMNGMPFCHG